MARGLRCQIAVANGVAESPPSSRASCRGSRPSRNRRRSRPTFRREPRPMRCARHSGCCTPPGRSRRQTRPLADSPSRGFRSAKRWLVRRTRPPTSSGRGTPPRSASLPPVWQVRQQVNLRVAVLRGLVQPNGDAARTQPISPIIDQLHPLLIDHARVRAARLAQFTDRFPTHIRRVLANEEVCLVGSRLKQKQSLKIPVGDPYLARLHRIQHVDQLASFLAWASSQGNTSVIKRRSGSSTTRACPGKGPAAMWRNSSIRCSVAAR